MLAHAPNRIRRLALEIVQSLAARCRGLQHLNHVGAETVIEHHHLVVFLVRVHLRLDGRWRDRRGAKMCDTAMEETESSDTKTADSKANRIYSRSTHVFFSI